jgi:hypothetical protein
MKFQKGVVALPVVIGLVLMAIALPFASKLAGLNQDNRNRAAGAHPPNCTCTAGKYTGSGCVALGYACSNGVLVPTKAVRCSTDINCGTNQRCVTGACMVDKCSYDLECLDGRCIAGTCTYRSASSPTPIVGSKCIVNSACGSGYHCKNFKCVANIAINGDCVYDSDCASNKCSGIVPNRKCVPPVKSPNGFVCTWDSDCMSGNCTGVGEARKCIAKKVNGSPCIFDNDCQSSHCIGNAPNRKCATYEKFRANGSDCLVDSVCKSGSCVSGKCKIKKCVTDSNCDKGYICTTNEGCVISTSRNRPDGSGCSQNFECNSNSCINGKCVNK